MATIEVPKTVTEQLNAMPESGMGYHIVDIKLSGGHILRRQVIVNGSQLKISRSNRGVEATQIEEVIAPSMARAIDEDKR